MAFVLDFVHVIRHIFWCAYVESSPQNRGKSHLVWVNDLSDCCWDLVASILLSTFSSWFNPGDWSVVSFVCSIFLWFGDYSDLGLIEGVWADAISSGCFWIVWEELEIVLFESFVEFSSEAFQSWELSVGRVFIS